MRLSGREPKPTEKAAGLNTSAFPSIRKEPSIIGRAVAPSGAQTLWRGKVVGGAEPYSAAQSGGVFANRPTAFARAKKVGTRGAAALPVSWIPRRRNNAGFALLAAAIATAILGVGATRADDLPSETLFKWPGFLPRAHSHNDYEQKRPLLDAVTASITSIEVDLFLEGEVIMVAHDRGKWRGEFEDLYLKPLNELWQKNALPVRDGETFLLWLDLKDGSAALRQHLHRLLKSYPVTRHADPSHARVQVILTGDKTAKEAFIEEYPSELVSRDSNDFSQDDPSASQSWSWYALDWRKIGTWDGEGAIPVSERERLVELVRRIHASGRKVRLWRHPATLRFWQEASACGVDRLGTDVLPGNEASRVP